MEIVYFFLSNKKWFQSLFSMQNVKIFKHRINTAVYPKERGKMRHLAVENVERQ